MKQLLIQTKFACCLGRKLANLNVSESVSQSVNLAFATSFRVNRLAGKWQFNFPTFGNLQGY